MHKVVKIFPHNEFSCCFRNPLATHSHCSLLHGYAPQFEFTFGCRELDDKYWVQDFGGLKELKVWLKGMFDHTVLIAKHDPHLLTFRTMDSMKIIDLREVDQIGMEYFAEIATKKAHSLVYEPSSGRVRCEQTLVREHPMNAGVYIL